MDFDTRKGEGMADYTLSVNIKGDSEEFKRALKAAQDAVDGFEKKTTSMSSKLNKIGDKMAGIGAKMSIGLTTPLTLAGKAAVNAASDYDENMNKIDVAFGKSGKAVKEWSETAIKEFGLSKNQALEAAALFGDMATSMGLTKPAASDMSISLASLAGDLASFKNIGVDQAMTALAGVFTGETESLKQLGIVMTETNLEEFANKSGLVYKNMSQAEKVQLRYNYVMAMSQNAVGDYARTADGTANSIRTFQGSVENLGIAFGQNLLPAVTPIIQKLTDIVNKFAELSPATQTNIIKIGLLAAAMGPLTTVAGGVTKAIGTTMSAMSTASQATSGFIAGFKGLDTKLSGTGAKFQQFGTTASKALRNLRTDIGALKINASDMAKSLKSSLTGTMTSISTSFTAAGSGIQATAASMKASLISVGTAAKAAIAPFLPAIAIFAAVAAAMVYLFNTNEEFRNSMLKSWGEISAAFKPVLEQLGTMISQVAAAITPAIKQLATAFSSVMTAIAPLVSMLSGIFAQTLVTIVGTISNLITTMAPLVSTLIGQIAPVMSTIIQAIAKIVSQIASALSPIIETVVSFLSGTAIPIITKVATTVASVISKIITVVAPIVTFISQVISKIISIISTIIGKVATIFNTVKTTITKVWNTIKSTVGTVVNGIISIIKKVTSPVRTVFNGVKSIVVTCFNAVKNAWGKLTGVVSGVVGGISSAFSSLVNKVKSVVNFVIGGINGAIGIINKIPGVEINKIPYLAHGTDNWQGGFAYMNEGGRGELTYLPNGAQVIPHDISVKYAKESARANASAEPINLEGLMNGMVVQIVNNTSVDGTPLKEIISDYTIKKIGNQQKAILRSRGYAY